MTSATGGCACDLKYTALQITPKQLAIDVKEITQNRIPQPGDFSVSENVCVCMCAHTLAIVSLGRLVSIRCTHNHSNS